MKNGKNGKNGNGKNGRNGRNGSAAKTAEKVATKTAEKIAAKTAAKADAKPEKKEKSSEYIGVSFIKRAKKYLASVRVDGKRIIAGYYKDPKEAALARDAAARKAGCTDEKRMNFPTKNKEDKEEAPAVEPVLDDAKVETETASEQEQEQDPAN